MKSIKSILLFPKSILAQTNLIYCLFAAGILFSCSSDHAPQTPTVKILNEPQNIVTQQDFTIHWSGEDKDGYIENYYYMFNGPQIKTTNDSVTLKNLVDGTNSFSVYAIDNDGLKSDQATIHFDVNLEKSIKIISPQKGDTHTLGERFLIHWDTENIGLDERMGIVVYNGVTNPYHINVANRMSTHFYYDTFTEVTDESDKNRTIVSDKYQVKVYLYRDPSIFALSEEFSVQNANN
uniref:hypothetical protein n=1 Tax=uncultured Draconibacterium sp. TaxID=1573823 RepID=UPI003216C73F